MIVDRGDFAQFFAAVNGGTAYGCSATSGTILLVCCMMVADSSQGSRLRWL